MSARHLLLTLAFLIVPQGPAAADEPTAFSVSDLQVVNDRDVPEVCFTFDGALSGLHDRPLKGNKNHCFSAQYHTLRKSFSMA